MMIVPRSRLLFWVGLVVVPFATLGALVPSAMLICVGMIGGLLVLVLLDMALSYGMLRGIRVECPEVVRLTKDREGALELRIQNETAKAHQLRLGLALPPEVQSSQTDLVASVPATNWSRLSWPCTPVKRGNYPLRSCYLEGISWFGFWATRSAVPIRTELRVYPNLMPERRNLAALFLNRGNFGLHAQRQVGKGRDFEKLREYIPGDSFEDVHWKATAKRGHPVTKIFQVERTQEIYVIIDASRLSARQVQGSGFRVQGSVLPTPSQPGTANPELGTELERFVTAALVLGLAAEKQGDLFGVVSFSDQVKSFVRAKNGKAHYDACRDALYTLQPELVNPNFDDLCTFLRLRLRRRALLVFLTNLDDPVGSESFVRNMDLLSRQHLVLVNMLRPANANALFSNPDVTSIDELYQRLGGHILWHDLRELERVLHHRGVQFALLENEMLSVQLVSQYLNVKRRQVL